MGFLVSIHLLASLPPGPHLVLADNVETVGYIAILLSSVGSYSALMASKGAA